MPTYILHVTDANGNPKTHANANPNTTVQCCDCCKTFGSVQAGDVLKFRNPDGRGVYFETVDSVETV